MAQCYDFRDRKTEVLRGAAECLGSIPETMVEETDVVSDRLVRTEKVLQRVEKVVFDIVAGESGDKLVIIQFSAPAEARSVSQT